MDKRKFKLHTFFTGNLVDWAMTILNTHEKHIFALPSKENELLYPSFREVVPYTKLKSMFVKIQSHKQCLNVLVGVFIVF